MENKIDLEKLVKKIDDPFLSNSVAFDNDKSVGFINKDLNSIKEALNNHDKIFLEIGFFGYDEDDAEEPYFIFDGENIIDVFYSIKDDLTYRVEYYYDGVIDDSKTEEYENIVYGTVINEYPEKVVDGYKFDKDSGKLVVTDDKDNVIKVYYTKIEEEVSAPNTGVDTKEYLFLILGMLPLGLLSIKRELDKVSIMK